MATQGFCGCLAVALIVIARRREAERFGFATEFGEKKGLALTKKNEFLYASPVVSRELVAEFPVERLRLLKCGQLLVGNEKPIIALEEVGDDEDFVARGNDLPCFKALKPVGRN
jgi:hypothetical protein